MSANLMPFEYEGQDIRTVTIGDDPWFVAADVARILGYRDAANLTRRLDDDERGTRSMSTPSGQQDMTVISESGLYSAILGSQVTGAKAFKKWVTSVLLPQIRKTGAYGQPTMTREELLSRAVLEATSAIAELEPKAKAFDTFLSSVGDYSVNEAAKVLSRDHGILTGQGRLFQFMETHGWIYRDAKNRPLPYQTQVDNGRLVAKPQFHYHPETGDVVADPPQIRVTAKGLEALRGKYLDDKALPA